jgi:hypothetical protein
MFTNNYTLGKGKVFLARLDPETKLPLNGFRRIGNCPEFSTSSAVETLQHYSSEGGLAELDASVDTQTNRTGAFTTDNISVENLALQFTGENSSLVQASATAVATTFTSKKGDYFQLGATEANPLGLRSVSSVVVSTTGGSPVVVAELDNYEVDLVNGVLHVLDDAVALTDDVEYEVVFNVAAVTRPLVLSKNNSIYAQIKFTSDNPIGTNFTYLMPYVKISPNGDFSLIGDDWQTMSFSMEILKRDSTTEAMYIDGAPVA